MLSPESEEAALRSGMRVPLLDGQDHIHHHSESGKRRVEIAHLIATLSFTGAIITTRATRNNEQELARARLLARLLPRLQHVERVDAAIIESRHGSDCHDRRTMNRLQRSRQVNSPFRVVHVRKRQDERLWLADFVVGAYVSALLHDEPEPWDIITATHVIDVN
ncbi:hypothetical protein [Streptoalloteichus hindustanus]|uniref:hypothetical protein n=1 Tax=Streptoalloteichus hindustanus TaxID=2017 RepID=UPI001160E48B|nr:hypothetical protein [Streptoalloteichus hindustanus]